MLCIISFSVSGLKGTKCPALVLSHLQGQGEANEIHHHLLVSELHADQSQERVEHLEVRLHAALLLTRQVNVSVELLGMLQQTHTHTHDFKEPDQRQKENGARLRLSLRAYLLHEEVVLTGTLLHLELKHGNVRDDATEGQSIC